ncbi:MAG: hypothetical protein GXO74_05595 [Calditrichaeota bacterium]|nr:hypothetical protein [Calditrichota bacterium]
MTLILILSITLILLGIYEKQKLNCAKKNQTLRIQVNGIRGKSTLVRMLTDLLTEAGKNVSARVTGETPQIFDSENGWQIFRRRGSARIKEISQFLQISARRKPDVMICENMALQPEYQRTFAQIFSPQISIYTNFRLDHQEIMGRTKAQIAETLSYSLPETGTAMLPEEENLRGEFNQRHADNLKILAKKSGSSNDTENNPFYFQFQALDEIGRELGILPTTIQKTKEKWGRKLAAENFVQSIFLNGRKVNFLNLFTCNDTESASEMVRFLQKNRNLSGKIAVILASREDRPLRTLAFVDWLQKEKFWDKLIIQGGTPFFAVKKRIKGTVSPRSIVCLRNKNVREILTVAAAGMDTIIGMGNFVHSGELFMGALQEFKDGN